MAPATRSMPAHAALTLTVTGIVVFLAVTLDVLLGGPLTEHLDRAVLSWAEPVGDTPATRTANLLARSGHWFVQGAALLAGAAALTVRRRDWRPFVLAGSALLIVGVLGLLVKEVIGRSGPRSGAAEIVAHGGAFPSGHAAGAVVVGVLLADLLSRGLPVLPRRGALLLGLAWAGAVGWCRLHLYVHWFTDVVAGWALGAAVVGAVWLIEVRLQARTSSRTFSGF